MKFKVLLVSLIAILLVVACAPAEVVDAPAAPADANVDESMEKGEDESAMEEIDSMAAEVSFSEDIWPIIEAEALDAHGGRGGVFLESYDDILEYVEPGNPEESVLYHVLTGDGQPLMPPDGPLPDEQIQLFYDWILQGAKDN